MLLYSDPLFLEHKTGGHPERPERLVQVVRQLERTGLDRQCVRPQWSPISLQRLARVHDLGYAANVEHFAQLGGGRIEADTVVAAASYDVALMAGGAVCDAVDRVLRGEDRQALCLVRPRVIMRCKPVRWAFACSTTWPSVRGPRSPMPGWIVC